jgi:hypothetical protein
LDEDESSVVIDIKNFGDAPARGVKWKALTGWFEKQPSDPVFYETEGGSGVTEPGHTQNIKLLLKGPLTSDHIKRIVRGGEGFYVLARIDYVDVDGTRKARLIAYYLDPKGERYPDKWMLSVCPTGNDEISGEATEPPWHEGRSHFSIREGGCLAAEVPLLDFDKSEKAQSAATQLLYFATSGAMPIATESKAQRAMRRAGPHMGSHQLPAVTFDSFITREDFEHFRDKALRVWLRVQDPAKDR